MRRQNRAAAALGTVAFVIGSLSGGATPARAQFPIFYGGEVLTPFGNRGSDGSYLTPGSRPRLHPPRHALRASRSPAGAPAYGNSYYFDPRMRFAIPQAAPPVAPRRITVPAGAPIASPAAVRTVPRGAGSRR